MKVGIKTVFAKGIIKSITENETVPDFSEESSDEDEHQPSKCSAMKGKEFDDGFHFLVAKDDYNYDHWNDVIKYIKRKATHKTDDKIARFKEKFIDSSLKSKEDSESEEFEECFLSDEDMEKDKIKIKSKQNIKTETANLEYKFSDSIEENNEITTFYQMNLSRPIMKSISELNFTCPTPIQSATIPVALSGRDICGCAATGTGKTAAYMLPILERLLYRPRNALAVTRVLVLVPTRELGVQVYQVSKDLARYTCIEIGLSVGGLDLKTQEVSLRKQPDVVIATPGRLIDHIKNTPGFGLDSIEVLVLDEADRMLDEYFAEQMKEIVKQCARTRQTLLFSATMTTGVQELAKVSLVDPVKIFVDNNRDVALNLRQEFIRIRQDKENDREAVLAALICRSFRSRCIVFVRTKSQAHRLHILLGLLNVQVAELHGNLRQPQRLDALKKFRDNVVHILVATDVAARGLDIVGVESVINYELPMTLEHYIHRVGRTARAGRSGISVSLAGESDRKLVKQIVKSANRQVKSRIIPPNILDKYKRKVENIQDGISNILKEELQERLMEKAQKQLYACEKKIKSSVLDNGTRREWFQTKSSKKYSKDLLKDKATLPPKDDGGKKRSRSSFAASKKDTKKKKLGDEDKKIATLINRQARTIKRKQKMPRLKSVVDHVVGEASGNKKFQKTKRVSTFVTDFSVSRNNKNKNKKRNTKFVR